MLLRLVGMVALLGAVPVWANSVYVSSSSNVPDQLPCQQSGSSYAFCSTDYSNVNGQLTGVAVSATATFGVLNGGFQASLNSSGSFASSFSDDVAVTGGSGAGTLVAHYSLATTNDAKAAQGAGSFAFVQGSTKIGFFAGPFVDESRNPPILVPPSCLADGLCFSENLDVSSPIQFGTALPLGAQMSLTSDDFGGLKQQNGINGGSDVRLTGYTVLDASGNVVSSAVVTPQNVTGLDLFAAPEPETWGLMVMGLAGLVIWKWRQRLGGC